MVLLSQKLNTKKTVSETIRSSEGHLLTDPQLLILHVSHKLVDSLHLLQLFSPLDQRLLNLGESGDKNLRKIRNNLFYTKLYKLVLKNCVSFSWQAKYRLSSFQQSLIQCENLTAVFPYLSATRAFLASIMDSWCGSTFLRITACSSSSATCPSLIFIWDSSCWWNKQEHKINDWHFLSSMTKLRTDQQFVWSLLLLTCCFCIRRLTVVRSLAPSSAVIICVSSCSIHPSMSSQLCW